MLGIVAWQLWGVKSVKIDRDGLRTYQRCLLWSRGRLIALNQVQHAQPYRPQVTNPEKQQRGVEIVYRGGSFVLPADSDEEERWLITEINDFVKSLAS